MKKKAAAFGVLLLTAMLFAEKTNLHGIGFSIPIESQLWLESGDVPDSTITLIGCNLDYKNMSMHIDRIVGFSAIFGLQAGYSTGASSDSSDARFDGGIDSLNMKWGWGVAVKPTEKIILAAHGTFGFDLQTAPWEDRWEPPYPIFAVRLGSDFVFAYKFTGSFGISAEIDGYIPVIGIGGYCYSEYDESWHNNTRYHAEFMTISGGFGTDVKFGICWEL